MFFLIYLFRLTAATTAVKCSGKNLHIPLLQRYSHSQFGEDMHTFLHYFPEICNGTYMEIGALDGDAMSNTHFFNTHLDWKGVLVEGSPFNYKKLRVNRNNEFLIRHNVVCSENSSLHYAVTADLKRSDGLDGAVHGIYEFMPEWYKQMFHGKNLTLVEVQCASLDSILTDARLNFIDFFSLDVEGAELSVLKTLNFHNFRFGLIYLENLSSRAKNSSSDASSMPVRRYLESKGYVYVETYADSVWMVNDNFVKIYNHLLGDLFSSNGVLRLISILTGRHRSSKSRSGSG